MWEGGEQAAMSKYVVVVEHDLAILDYMSDFVQCLYGRPGAYGVVTKRSNVRNGINQFLAGYIEQVRSCEEQSDELGMRQLRL